MRTIAAQKENALYVYAERGINKHSIYSLGAILKVYLVSVLHESHHIL